ncbi:MAG TPA: hypothetical protein VK658_05745 [Chryseolinea sp.]|nr:hypothetical protein [Chryseolinea sp.]
MDKFIEYLFSPIENGMTVDRSLEIMEESFPELLGQRSNSQELMAWVANQPINNRDVINSILSPIMHRKSMLRLPQDWVVYKLDNLGYILIYFHFDDNASKNMVGDMYFMPLNTRYGMGYETEVHRFPSCYTKQP